MRFFLLTNFYPPEVRSISTMMRELAEGLAERGHEVTVFTSWPKENVSPDAQLEHLTEDAQEGAVRVVRVKVPSSYFGNYVWRGLAQLVMPYFFWRAVRRLNYEKVDGVIVYTPHLPLTLVGERIKKKYGARYLLNVQDIFPQNAIDLGIMRNKLFIRFFEWLEARAYREADVLTTHTEGGRRFLVEKKYVPESKISVVPNWVNIAGFKNIKRTGIFRQRYGLENKFIFLFAGIFGPSQHLEFVIEIARHLKDVKDAVFLFVGDGTEKLRLQKLVADHQLDNVHFEPFVSPAEYPFLVKDVDVGILCLSMDNTTAVVPGKLWGFMASACPVVAFLQPESDGHRIIKEARCGYSLGSDNVEKAARVVRQMFEERGRLDEYGRNGYDYVLTHFSTEACVEKLASRVLSF